MKKLSKKALIDAFKNHFLFASELLCVSSHKCTNGEIKYYVTFKDYQVYVYNSSFGVSGWINGSITLMRTQELLEVLKTFNED